MATNTNITINDIPHRAMDVNLIGIGSNNNGLPIYSMSGWNLQTNAKGSIGTPLTITPSSGTLQAFEFIIVAIGANDDAALVIKRDSTSIFDGYLMNRDGDFAIKFPGGDIAATESWEVTVTGGSGDLFVLVRHN